MGFSVHAWLKPIALTAVAVALAPSLLGAGETYKAPYVVSGNQHIIVGITLDEAAVRAALPEGLKPTKNISGGLNVYTSKGGGTVPAYTRSYVWADVEGYDSINGTKGRFILWVATNPGAGKLGAIGYDEVKGDTKLMRDGKDLTGSTMVDGKEVMKVAIKLGDDPCGPAMGTLNYPSLPSTAKSMVMTQYAFTGSICGATAVSADISVGNNHPLAKFKPTAMVWAAFAEDLSFSGSPQIPIKMAGN